MTQLLEIKCIPIKLEFKTQPMKMEISRKQEASLEIEREKGGLTITKNKLKTDKIEISKGPHAVPLRTARKNVQNAVPIPSAKNDKNPSKIPKREAGITEPIKLRSSTAKKDFNKDINEVVMEYKMDKIKFNCSRNEFEVNFIPGSIEYIVSQYPDVEIEYIGDMIYVPPSANPDYEEPEYEQSTTEE